MSFLTNRTQTQFYVAFNFSKHAAAKSNSFSSSSESWDRFPSSSSSDPAGDPDLLGLGVTGADIGFG